jgi:hypothetical protein
MPNFIKHVGQVNATGKKCVIVFRSLPNDSNNCLVVETESLPSLYHDTLIEAVESPSAQAEKDFYSYAGRSVFHDGVNMLQGLHQNGWMRKFPTEDITVKPTPDMGISLLDLNRQLSALDPEGKTTSGAINTPTPEEPSNAPGTLSDKQIAAQMRSQATFFRNEADRLLKEANDLDPHAGQKIAEVTEMPRQKRAYNRKK